MRRSVAQRAVGLAQATLADAGLWAPCSIAAAFRAPMSTAWATASGAAAVSVGRNAAAAAAAAALHRCGLHSWASQQQLGDLAGGSAAPRQPFMQQQRAAASAQAEPSTSSSDEASGSGTGGLSLSDAAVQRLKELQEQSNGAVVLRVTVEGGGCSGFQYEFSIEEGTAGAAAQPAETDRLFEKDGVRLVCDDISLEFLKGAIVDFESDLMRSAFVIATNPNAASSCGCGSSFVAK